MVINKTENVRLFDKVMTLAKAQGRENEVVKTVIVDPQKTNGVCVRCQEEGEVLRFSVFVYTGDYPPKAIREEKFTVDYCQWCLSQVMNHSEDALRVMFN